MTNISIPVGDDHFLKFEQDGDTVKLFDVHYERITPGNPTKHFVNRLLYTLKPDDVRDLTDFFASVGGHR